MRRIQAATVIAAPLERVFALLAPAEQAHWYSPGARVEVRDLSSGPVGKGSTWTIVERSRFGSDAMRIEVTAYEPPTRYQSRATASMFTGTLTVTLTPEGGGTLVTLAEEFSARGPGKLFEGVFARSGQKRDVQALERLKAMVEGGE